MIARIYNDANELTSTTTGGVTTAYTYDGWGRTISKTDGTHDATYTWRFGDKLRVYTTDFPGESSTGYNYDGLGKRRVRVQNVDTAYTDAEVTYYRWDAAWNLIGEYESDDFTAWDVGALEKHYTFLPSSKGTQLSHVDGSAPASGAYNYYAHDHLGSPRGVYSQAQAVVATQEFTPYGSHYATTGPSQTVGFTGHHWDPDVKSYYAPYRYYNPGSARWLSRDPLGMVDGPNVYGYASGSPVVYIDSHGLWIAQAIAIGLAAIRLAGKLITSLVKRAAQECKKIQCKIAFHGKHHKFPWGKEHCHIQINCFRKGVKGSGFLAIRIPMPCMFGKY